MLDVMGRKSAFPMQTGPFSAVEQYRPMESERDWNFFHPDARLPEQVLARIRPLTEDYCRALWWTYVSEWDAPNTITLPDGEWPRTVITSGRRLPWVEDWNAGRSEQVSQLLREHVPWPDDAVAYFFWTNWRGVETRWSVFRDHWMSFVFDDEGPVLISPDHREAVIVTPGGYMHVGLRPETRG